MHVGATLSANAIYESLAINASGTPYVAFEDPSNGSGATIKKFDFTDAAEIVLAQAALNASAPINPVEGTDTNIVTMAQAIVNASSSGVTVSMLSSANTQIASNGTITYGATAVTGNVSFTLTDNAGTSTSVVSVVVPESHNSSITPSVSVSGGGGGSAYDLSINNGMATTISPNVTLSLYGTGAYTMELSNNSNFTSSTWIPYATSIPWPLASSTGEKTVYVKFRNVSGSIVGNAEKSITVSTPSLPTTSSSTANMSLSQLENLLASLEAEFQTLEKEASSLSTKTSPLSFTRNLELWDGGVDVKNLQEFLISQASGSAAQKLKTHGVTEMFGSLTLDALIEFQKSVGISPASGYFGPITRAYVNGHYSSNTPGSSLFGG